MSFDRMMLAGSILQLSMQPGALFAQAERNTREIAAAEAPRGAVVMASRAARKMTNFAGVAAKAATMPSALIFEVVTY